MGVLIDSFGNGGASGFSRIVPQRVRDTAAWTPSKTPHGADVRQLTAHSVANAATASIATRIAFDMAPQNLRTMLIIGKTKVSSAKSGMTRPKSAESFSPKNRRPPLANPPPLNT
jgi:hypothetical protein